MLIGRICGAPVPARFSCVPVTITSTAIAAVAAAATSARSKSRSATAASKCVVKTKPRAASIGSTGSKKPAQYNTAATTKKGKRSASSPTTAATRNTRSTRANSTTTSTAAPSPPPRDVASTPTTEPLVVAASDLVDPAIARVSTFLARPTETLNIVVDATALLYRMAFAHRTVCAYHSDAPMEVDPTPFLHRSLPRFLEFVHSVIPVGDGSAQQPHVLPPDVAAEALRAGFLAPSGSVWRTAEQEMKSMAARARAKAGVDAGVRSDDLLQVSLRETQDSPGFLKRRVILCFDHGSESQRAATLPDYKATRARCGRVYSFLGLASAMARQLHSAGLVQAVFPPELESVDLDGKLCIQGSRQQLLRRQHTTNDSATENEKAPPPRSSVASMLPTNDAALHSLLRGATDGNTSQLAISGEADDLVHSCTKYFTETLREPVLIVSHDKDLFQLLEFPRTYYYNLGSSRFVLRSDVCDEYGISSPKHLADYLAIMGDTCDNVRGLEGTGTKRTRAIMKHYGTLDNLIAVAAAAADSTSATATATATATAAAAAAASPAAQQQGVVAATKDVDSSNKDTEARTTTPKKKKASKAAAKHAALGSGKYAAGFLDMVHANAPKLIAIRDQVTRLRDSPALDEHLARTIGDAAANSAAATTTTDASPLPHTSHVVSPPIAFTSVPPHIWSTAAFARYSSPQWTAEHTKAVWPAVRRYYTDRHGPCLPADEVAHRCGMPLKRKDAAQTAAHVSERTQRRDVADAAAVAAAAADQTQQRTQGQGRVASSSSSSSSSGSAAPAAKSRKRKPPPQHVNLDVASAV